MLVIEKNNFLEKFTEINIRQRVYKGESFITLIVNTEFYPSFINSSIISGSVEVKLDVNNIKSIDDLVGNSYEGDIGKVTISVNNDGIWEHQTKEKFKFKINKRDGRNLSFYLECDNCKLETNGVMVSLYTTSTNKEELEKNFDLSDFYDNSFVREIGNSKIMKFYVKE